MSGGYVSRSCIDDRDGVGVYECLLTDGSLAYDVHTLAVDSGGGRNQVTMRCVDAGQADALASILREIAVEVE